MIQFVGSHNIREMWAVNVGNSLNIKHYVLLLQNRGFFCSCLSIIQCGIVCRHYFQVMLVTKETFFHIQLIPARWYTVNKEVTQESFLVADKFIQDNQATVYNYDETIESSTS